MNETLGSREHFEAIMDELLNRAVQTAWAGEVPVVATLLDKEYQPITVTENMRERTGNPLAHAEVLAIQEAAEKLGTWNLEGHTLIVTLEPCLLCAAAIQAARVSHVVYGAWDEKAGAVGSVYDILRDRRLPYNTSVTAGIRADESAQLMKQFFEKKRS